MSEATVKNNNINCNKLKCVEHAIPIGENKLYYSMDEVRQWADAKIDILKNDENYFLVKVFYWQERHCLIRELNGKMDVWEFENDFNIDEAIDFMTEWDDIYPFENMVSVNSFNHLELKESLEKIKMNKANISIT